MSMTALVSAFARAYHAGREGAKIFEDRYARRLLSDEEYGQIGAHMAAGVSFFDPAFRGDAGDALRRVMDGYLSPTPLARTAFAAEELARSGAEQVLSLAAGYDTVGYDSGLPLFEADRPEVLADKQARLEHAGLMTAALHFVPADLSQPGWAAQVTAAAFDKERPTFCAVMGLSYYLTEEETALLLREASSLLFRGSWVVLDVPIAAQRCQGALAAKAGEAIKAVYDRDALERMAQSCGLHLASYLTPEDIQSRFFAPYNCRAEAPMYAPQDVAYCVLEQA